MAGPAEVLERIGLSQNQIKVYLVLNDFGSTTAGRIAKHAKIDRSSCYYALRSLIERGLVSYATIGRVKYFQATGPDRLLDYLREQEDEVRQIIPELSARHKVGKIEGQVRLFKGIKGVKSIFLDIIRNRQDNFAFGSEGQFSTIMPEFVQQFERLKQESNIKTRQIVREGRKEVDTKTTEYRHLPVAKSSAVTNIYGKKIAIIVWTSEPEGIIIENETAAKAFKSYFDFMWKHAKSGKGRVLER
jgi:sugar-specific transcriptional regulator TrmB